MVQNWLETTGLGGSILFLSCPALPQYPLRVFLKIVSTIVNPGTISSFLRIILFCVFRPSLFSCTYSIHFLSSCSGFAPRLLLHPSQIDVSFLVVQTDPCVINDQVHFVQSIKYKYTSFCSLWKHSDLKYRISCSSFLDKATLFLSASCSINQNSDYYLVLRLIKLIVRWNSHSFSPGFIKI